jgi:hypothetical protein
MTVHHNTGHHMVRLLSLPSTFSNDMDGAVMALCALLTITLLASCLLTLFAVLTMCSTILKVPAAVREAKQALADGHCVIIELQSTVSFDITSTTSHCKHCYIKLQFVALLCVRVVCCTRHFYIVERVCKSCSSLSQ